MKRTRFYIGVTLLIQAASLFMMFIMLCRKKKSLSKVIFAVALAGGLTGAYLVFSDYGSYPRRRKPPMSAPSEASFEDDAFLFDEEDSNEIEICDGDCKSDPV